MKNKLTIIGYSVIIVIAFYLVIYAITPSKINMEEAFNQYVYNNITLEVESGEESGEELSSGEELYSGENIATLAVSTIEEDIKGDAKQKNKETKKEEHGTKKLTSNATYYIKVNNTQNVVTIYKKDANGEYTIPYKAMVCSTGDATPAAGKMYKITTYKKRWNGLQGDVYGQYATQIIGNILFHSVPYTAKDNSTLEYWEYDKLGTAASLGCIRLTVADAKWIYDNISSGTIVEFYEDSNPGPLGKPSARKITDNEQCRGWDPTDPAKENPWNAPIRPEIQETVNTLINQPEIIVIDNDVNNLNKSGEEMQNGNIL